MKRAPYKTVLCGLGRIGFGYTDNTAKSITHYSALLNHPRFEIVAAVDPLEEKRKSFQSKTGVSALIDLSQVGQKVDFVIIATPPEFHAQVFAEALKLRPRAILIEKPAFQNADESKTALSLAGSINLYVNFFRDFEPAFMALPEKFGKTVLGGNLLYSKGIRNNGSHWLQLLGRWFGQAETSRVLRVYPERAYNLDPTLDFELCYKGFSIYGIGLKEDDYSSGELSLFFDNGRVRITNFGEEIEHYQVSRDPDYQDIKRLVLRSEMLKPNLDQYQYHVLEAIAHDLDNNLSSSSNFSLALKTISQIDALLGEV